MLQCNKAENACEWSIKNKTFDRFEQYEIRVYVTNKLGKAKLTLRAVAPVDIGKLLEITA